MIYVKFKDQNFRKFKTILLLFLLANIVLSCSNNKLIVADKGTSDFEIITENTPSLKIKESAMILQNYLKKITAIELPIVAKNNANPSKNSIRIELDSLLNTNEIKIISVNDDIIISGGSDEAVNNAIFEFLEIYLNCKWWAPNVEDVPQKTIVKLQKPLSYNYEPYISTRTVHSKLFYENSDFAQKHKVTNESFPYYVPVARVHTFHKFIPEEIYFKEHPEYFSLRNNKRTPTQLCLTNEKVFEIVRDSVTKLFEKYPEATVISVSQNDNQQYCQCDLCSAIDLEEGSPSGKTIRFVNRIAEEFPNKTISTLAYQHTRKPSKTKPKKNVLITLCSIECDRSAPIEEKCQDFSEDLKGWGLLTDNIRIWDYTTQFTNFLAPFPNLKTLQPNIQLFRDNHTKWVFEQHSNNPSELFELRSYIMAKLLWNPDANFEDLIFEFTEGYYQEAGVYIRNYIDLIHDELAKDKDFFLFLYGDPSQAFSSYLNPELLKTYNDFYNEAENAVADKPEVLQRVKQARISVDYATLEASKKNLTEQFSLVNTNSDNQKIANPFIEKKLGSFYNTCNNASITLMNEMGFTVDEYYNSYKKAMEVAAKPNKAKGKKVILLTKPKKYANEDPQTLTDGALGGNNFYANWLGFEGNHLEAVVDLEQKTEIHSISMAFLQVTNHVVFFPKSVTYFYSHDGKNFTKLGMLKNDKPLLKTSKINDIKYFNLEFPSVKARYVKVVGESLLEPPYWHHAAGTPAWIFADEIIID